MKIAVIVATLGRPEEVGQLLQQLARQSTQPSIVILSVESEADLPLVTPEAVRVVIGPRGSCVQRNRGLDIIGDAFDLVVFFDDDYLPCDASLAGVSKIFNDNPEVVGATGWVLDDGIGKGGIAYDTAINIVRQFDQAPQPTPRILADVRGVYGCNMAFRVSALDGIRFDENLPLYGWQEDVDFAARLLQKGRVVKTNAFAGVHRGVTRGRTSGVKFGFSQMVNPVYLVRKGSMRRRHAYVLMARNFVANLFRGLAPEPWVDRRGRLRGNWLGLSHLMSGATVSPAKVLDIT